MAWKSLLTIGCIVISCGVFSGCQPGEDASRDGIRERFLTEQIPEVANTIQQVIDKHELDEQSLSKVTLVGRIHGGELSPFDAGKASFALSELPEPGHSHDDPGDCPFCKRKAENAPIAVVNFLDEAGATIAMPADKLFGLSKNQDVVVTGTGVLLDNMLLVEAASVSVVGDLETAIGLREEIAIEAEVISEPDIDIDALLPTAADDL